MANKNSLTGRYLAGINKIEVPKKRRKGNGKFLEIKKAEENNLKKIDVKYQAYANGRWLSDIINFNEHNDMGYAGIFRTSNKLF